MPNCFQLYPKGQTTAATLNSIDAAICNHVGVPVHPKFYCADWFNVIGFLIAVKGFHLGTPELRAAVEDWYLDDRSPYRLNERDDYALDCCLDQLVILDYLEQHYRSDAWVEIGKR